MNKSCYLFWGKIVKQFALFSEKFTQLLKNFTRSQRSRQISTLEREQGHKGKRSLKAFNEEDLERLWLPLVVYANTDQQETTRLGMDWEWSTSVSVLREGNFTRSDLTVFDEIEIFKGEENNLVKEQAYTHELSSSVFTS